MLIEIEKLKSFLNKPIKGVIHCGAHLCEEDSIYDSLNIKNRIWIDAIKLKPNVIEACLYSEDNKQVTFNVSNNIQSSSILELGTHRYRYPYIDISSKIILKTIKLDTLISNLKLDMNNYNFLNLDLQGVELDVLKGLENNLCKIDYIYTEINNEEIYKKCSKVNELIEYLEKKGFFMAWIDKDFLKLHGWSDALFVKRIN